MLFRSTAMSRQRASPGGATARIRGGNDAADESKERAEDDGYAAVSAVEEQDGGRDALRDEQQHHRTQSAIVGRSFVPPSFSHESRARRVDLPARGRSVVSTMNRERAQFPPLPRLYIIPIPIREYDGLELYEGYRAGLRAIRPCQMNRYGTILAVYVFLPQNFSSGGRPLKQKY